MTGTEAEGPGPPASLLSTSLPSTYPTQHTSRSGPSVLRGFTHRHIQNTQAHFPESSFPATPTMITPVFSSPATGPTWALLHWTSEKQLSSGSPAPPPLLFSGMTTHTATKGWTGPSPKPAAFQRKGSFSVSSRLQEGHLLHQPFPGAEKGGFSISFFFFEAGKAKLRNDTGPSRFPKSGTTPKEQKGKKGGRGEPSKAGKMDRAKEKGG